MKIIRGLHTGYGLIIFSLLFFLLLPIFLIAIVFPKQFKLVGIANRWWAKVLLTFVGIPFRVEYRKKLDHTKSYIFCPNHFSYLDIAALALNKHNTIFVGKNDMVNIPLFGFMYGKLHITVDRAKLKSRYSTVKKSLQAIDEGKSLVIFPEGGIMMDKEPIVNQFKDGAFRVAIEKQIAVVPVTIPYNWIILPAKQFLLHWHPLHVVFHEPIETTGLSLADVDALKEKVFAIVDEELKQQLAKLPKSDTLLASA